MQLGKSLRVERRQVGQTRATIALQARRGEGERRSGNRRRRSAGISSSLSAVVAAAIARSAHRGRQTRIGYYSLTSFVGRGRKTLGERRVGESARSPLVYAQDTGGISQRTSLSTRAVLVLAGLGSIGARLSSSSRSSSRRRRRSPLWPARLTLGALPLLFIVTLRRRAIVARAHHPQDAVPAVFATALPFLIMSWASSTSIAASPPFSTPRILWTALLAAAFLSHEPSRGQGAGRDGDGVSAACSLSRARHHPQRTAACWASWRWWERRSAMRPRSCSRGQSLPKRTRWW